MARGHDNAPLLGMYHHLATGVNKGDSKYVTDQESSDKWDSLEKEVNDIKSKGLQLGTVHDIPDMS